MSYTKVLAGISLIFATHSANALTAMPLDTHNPKDKISPLKTLQSLPIPAPTPTPATNTDSNMTDKEPFVLPARHPLQIHNNIG